MPGLPTPFAATFPDLLASALQRAGDIARTLFRPAVSSNDVAAKKRHPRAFVWLVGAGPGDPELLTLKALRALSTADVILHDQLVSREVLALAPVHAQCIDVGKKGYGRACQQADINRLMVGYARAGRRVVRLKAGDPLMFGRLEEEIGALRAADIGFEVVPGISAAQGACSSLGIPLTRRRGARRFQAITGHAASGGLPDDFDWSGLADPKAMTAVYMPKATIAALCAGLMRRGLPPSHPAFAVFNVSRADQRLVTGTIATLPTAIIAAASNAPCIVLIGAGAEQHLVEQCARSAEAVARP